jgi:putative pyruvate formate lyase activating enzyme
MDYIPPYISLYENGTLEELQHKLWETMQSCTLCAQQCGVDRTAGELGKCNSGVYPQVASYSPHFGEEAPLVGRRGSGTIFFSNCNLACVYCQNYDISHLGYGSDVSCEQLARMMLLLQERGCHNINFVTPSHMQYAIVKALSTAVAGGLAIPLVYNTGGYDNVDTLRMLECVFDIYMPDMKYMDADTARELSDAPDYPRRATAAIREMHNQVGDLEIGEEGIARRGLLVRHLVLPNNLSQSKQVIDFIASLSKETYLNIMDQYRPMYRADEYSGLRGRIIRSHLRELVAYARKSGLRRIDGY